MRIPKHTANPFGRPIYTLAQSGTAISTKSKEKPAKVVKGKGTDTLNAKPLLNRAKKKLISQTLCLSLVDVANKKGNPDMAKAYWNTYHCQSRVIGAGGKLYGNYCKNRFCNICSGIKKAELINKYYPVICKWPKPYFVTLTALAVTKDKLKNRTEQYFKYFRQIVEKYRKRAQRGKASKLMGIKSFECNFNPKENSYNPHFHLIVPDLQTAKSILFDWLAMWGKAEATYNAQAIILISNLDKCLVEVIKYSCKVFTDPTMDKKKGKTGKGVPHIIYISAYDNIIEVMRSIRVFERFGFNLPPQKKERKFTEVTTFEELIFDPKQHDWLSAENKERLTGYVPSAELLKILRGNIDMEAE